MKSANIIIVFFTLLTHSVFAGGGSLTFNKLTHQFGIIEEGRGPVTYTFKFKNSGGGPIKITNILTSCGCTTSDYTRTAILSGDSGFVRAIFDPKNRPGPFSRTLTVVTNGLPEMYTLTVEGNVGSPRSELLAVFPYQIGQLRFTKNELNYGNVKQDKIDSLYIGIYNPTGKHYIIKKASSPYPIHTEINNKMIASLGGEDFLFTYNGALTQKLGPRIDTMYLLTDDDSVRAKMIIVRANIVQNFDKLTPEQLAKAPSIVANTLEGNIEELYLGETGVYTFDVENTGKSDLLLMGFYSDCKCINASFEKGKIKKGSKGKLILTMDTKRMHGDVIKKAIVITNDPKNPEKKFILKTKVVIPGLDPSPLVH